MMNEMRLRFDFLEIYLSNIVQKKAWEDISYFRDLCLCCNHMLKVLLEHHMGKKYPSFKLQQFGLCPQVKSLLFEASHASFLLYYMCEEMDEKQLSLLYRICSYILPKIRLISLPNTSSDNELRNCIDMQKM